MDTGLLCVLLAATSTLSMGASDSGSGLCESMVSCLEDGVTTCTTANTTCPPCIYKLATGYTCWSKDNTTNSCPFTGVVYDCCTLSPSSFTLGLSQRHSHQLSVCPDSVVLGHSVLVLHHHCLVLLHRRVQFGRSQDRVREPLVLLVLNQHDRDLGRQQRQR